MVVGKPAIKPSAAASSQSQGYATPRPASIERHRKWPKKGCHWSVHPDKSTSVGPVGPSPLCTHVRTGVILDSLVSIPPLDSTVTNNSLLKVTLLLKVIRAWRTTVPCYPFPCRCSSYRYQSSPFLRACGCTWLFQSTSSETPPVINHPPPTQQALWPPPNPRI